MYSDTLRPGLGGLPTVVLRSAGGESECEVIPGRGGLVSRFRVGDDEALFLDESTVIDPTKNVRGGIPVLFPYAGKLPGEVLKVRERSFPAPQHGFARKMSWELVEQGSDGRHAWAESRLVSTPETLAVFPWPFALTLRVTLEGARLTLDTRIENTGTAPLPHALGFHPYFRVPDAQKPRAGVRTDAKLALDNTTGQRVTLGKLDFTPKEVDLHLIGHSTPGTLVRRGDFSTLALGWSPAFTTLVLWTLAGRDFLCVEPWESPAGALATEHHPVLLPGQSIDLVFTITAMPSSQVRLH